MSGSSGQWKSNGTSSPPSEDAHQDADERQGKAVAPARFGDAERQAAEALIALALTEDLGIAGDITAEATIKAHLEGRGAIISREPGVLCGLPVVSLLGHEMGLSAGWQVLAADGTRLERGFKVARITGRVRDLLAFERTALNFLQRLSGVATLTRRFVDAVAGTKAVILDTRKTTPGWRILEKYAVRCGGGTNHRTGLYDAVLIKDNHLAALAEAGEPDPIGLAVARGRAMGKKASFVEVEVDSLEQLRRALECRPDIVLVDNFTTDRMREAVQMRDKLAAEVLIEASGGVNLDTVRGMAEAGVDRISVGALDSFSAALDLALDYETTESS